MERIIDRIMEASGYLYPSILILTGVVALLCAVFEFPEANHQFALGGVALSFGIITLIDETSGK